MEMETKADEVFGGAALDWPPHNGAPFSSRENVQRNVTGIFRRWAPPSEFSTFFELKSAQAFETGWAVGLRRTQRANLTEKAFTPGI